ncbi:MAG: hypothetical protein WCF17_20425 [Terracidiphilus sp.]
MKTVFASLAFAALLCAGVQAQNAPDAARTTAITGVWRGDMNGLPAVVMVVSDEGGQLTGAALFYLQIRKNASSPTTSTAGIAEPMLQPTFDGTTLRFAVSHRRAHPPHTLNDPPMPFHLKLIGPDKAELQNEREGPPLVVTRSAY